MGILIESSKMVSTTSPLALLFALLGSTLAQSCDPAIFVEKIHAWNKGYTGKMYLDQGWLTQQTSDSVFWRLTATFQNEVKEFKVWDADIINPNPATGNKYVNNVTSVEVLSKFTIRCFIPASILSSSSWSGSLTQLWTSSPLITTWLLLLRR